MKIIKRYRCPCGTVYRRVTPQLFKKCNDCKRGFMAPLPESKQARGGAKSWKSFPGTHHNVAAAIAKNGGALRGGLRVAAEVQKQKLRTQAAEADARKAEATATEEVSRLEAAKIERENRLAAAGRPLRGDVQFTQRGSGLYVPESHTRIRVR
jgi:predicted  nucleic acid-binding Zn-ribbon protein